MNKKLIQNAIFLLCNLLIPIGVLYIVFSLFIPKTIYQYKSSDWLFTDGVVDYSYVSVEDDDNAISFNFRYSYIVGGKEYFGDKFNIGYQGIKSFYLCLALGTLSR